MTANVAGDSHWVSRSFLKRWEQPAGSLRVFDFRTGRVEGGSANRTFVSPTPFPLNVEEGLHRVVETPLGRYVARGNKAGAVLVPTANGGEDQAIVIALQLQSLRTQHAQGVPQLDDLGNLLARGADDRRREFVVGSRDMFEFFGVTLHQDELYFPSTGTVALPVLGVHGWMLPISPTTFVACLPKFEFAQPGGAGFPIVPGDRQAALEALVSQPGMMATISVGIAGDRVVLPPGMRGTDEEIATRMRAHREEAQALNRVVAIANAEQLAKAPIGFPGDARRAAAAAAKENGK